MKGLRLAMALTAGMCAAATAMSIVNLRHLRRPGAAATDARISVLVPARDEAARIEPTLRSLRNLIGVEEVLVLDDNSSDGTADLVEAAGLRVIRSREEPPAGWLGKPWACQRLAQAARGDALVFIDADVELAPDAAVRAVALLEHLDLVCPYPRQITHGWLQRLVQPLLQWSWLTFLPLELAERSAHPMLSAGNGQFMAVRKQAYAGAGGHASVRDRVLEDLALVRQFKAAGLQVAMADGTSIAACRMYASSRDLVDGYTKSLHDAFGPATVGLLGLLYVVPIGVALTSRDRPARILAAGAYLVAVAGRVAVARRTRQPIADGFAHPASILGLTALYARSVLAARRGRLTWRGRALDRGARRATG